MSYRKSCACLNAALQRSPDDVARAKFEEGFLLCLRQNLPALLLLVGLRKIPEQMIKGFCAFAGGLRVLITAGLILAAVEYMCGWNPVKGMAPITDAMAVVASIGVVLLGSLPVAEFLQRILKTPFAQLGGRLGMKPESMTGLLLSLVSLFPMLSLYHEMDEMGRVMNEAFTVSAVSLLAAHIGFAMSVEPQMTGPMIAAKLCGGVGAWEVQKQDPCPGIADAPVPQGSYADNCRNKAMRTLSYFLYPLDHCYHI